MSKFITTMPKNLQDLIRNAENIESGNKETALQSIRNMDITSLKESQTIMIGTETADEIKSLCQLAEGSQFGKTAAICVYPNQIENVKKYLQSVGEVKIAVVNNFPHGDLSAEDASNSALNAIEAGAHEIDTVIDYQAFIEGNVEEVTEKLKAVRKVCLAHRVKLKTILKASIYVDYEDLYDAALLAIECGCDFVKTCTGKLAKGEFDSGTPDASTLETAATVMQAVADSKNKNIGVKISGGVKTALDCEKMKYLADNILGTDYFVDKKKFRFGASSLMGNLEEFLLDNKETGDKNPENY